MTQRSDATLRKKANAMETILNGWISDLNANAMEKAEETQFMSDVRTLEAVYGEYGKVVGKHKSQDPDTTYEHLIVTCAGRLYDTQYSEISGNAVVGDVWELICRYRAEHQFLSKETLARGQDLLWGVFEKKTKIQAQLDKKDGKLFFFLTDLTSITSLGFYFPLRIFGTLPILSLQKPPLPSR